MANSAQSEWHTIRPWTPRITLSVREITSVSATFILSSSLSGDTSNGQSEPSPASLGLVTHEDDESSNSDSESESDEAAGAAGEFVISNALAKGLSVNVNGTPWQRVIIRMDDKADAAVIIIYGLMPGRQYDIDLGLVQGGQGGISLRRQVITEGAFFCLFIFNLFCTLISKKTQNKQLRIQKLITTSNLPHPQIIYLLKLLHQLLPTFRFPPHLNRLILALHLMSHSKSATHSSNMIFHNFIPNAAL